MKAVQSALLFFCFIAFLPAMADAEGQSAEFGIESILMDAHTRLQPVAPVFRGNPDLVDAEFAHQFSGQPDGFSISAGHAALFLLTITGIDIVAEDLAKNGLSLSAIDPAELERHASAASDKILGSGQVWTSLGASAVLSRTLQRPIGILAELASQSRGRSQFAQLLTNSIKTSVSFVGWEFGSQLCTEAGLLVESQADYKRLQSTFQVGRGAIKSVLFKSVNAQDENDRRLAALMLGNLLRVLILDQNLTRAWFNNTWRLHIMTGEFATMLSTMVASGALGSAIFPGGGTFVGLLFGLAGIGVAMVIPQQPKDEITYSLQGIRRRTVEMKLYPNFVEIQERAKIRFPWNALPLEERQKTLLGLLGARENIFRDLFTIQFERLHLAIRAAQSASETGKANDPKRSAPILTELENSQSYLQTTCASENKDFDTLISSLSSHGARTSRRRVDDLSSEADAQAIQDTVNKARANFNVVCNFLVAFDTRLKMEILALGENRALDSLLKFIDVSYARGFNAEQVLQRAALTRHN